MRTSGVLAPWEMSTGASTSTSTSDNDINSNIAIIVTAIFIMVVIVIVTIRVIAIVAAVPVQRQPVSEIIGLRLEPLGQPSDSKNTKSNRGCPDRGVPILTLLFEVLLFSAFKKRIKKLVAGFGIPKVRRSEKGGIEPANISI